MTYKVELTPFAEQTLLDLALYIAQDKPAAALNWVNYLEDSAFSLADAPYKGREYKRGYRIFVLKNGYVIYYGVDEDRKAIVIADFGVPGQPLRE